MSKNTPEQNMIAEAFFQQIDRLNSSNAGQDEILAVLEEFNFHKVTAEDVKAAMLEIGEPWTR